MSAPEISVVMAAGNAAGTVEACLHSLERQPLFASTEVIVADCSTDGTDRLIRRRFPGVQLLHYDSPTGLPEMLRDALALAKGRIVAVAEPHCIFAEDWLEKLRQSHESEFAVIGGAVENGCPDGTMSWACFLADYGAFMLPAERHVARELAGNHISYKRALIREALPQIKDGYWKVFFLRDLEQRGLPFLFEPSLVVYLMGRKTLGVFLRDYFEHGWFFASMLSRRISRPARLARVLASPLLPPLHLYRRLRDALGKRRHTGKLLEAIPLLAVFVTVWSAGEFMGYLLGPNHLPREAYR